jgi:hypothetical protein
VCDGPLSSGCCVFVLFVLVAPHHGGGCFLVFIGRDHLFILEMNYARTHTHTHTHTLQNNRLVCGLILGCAQITARFDLLSDRQSDKWLIAPQFLPSVWFLH